MSKRRGLGKGLQALIPVAKEVEEGEKLREIDIDQIQPAPGQPRKKFDREKLDGLAASIREHGVIQPVVVRPLKEGGGYQLIAGERRWRACKLIGYSRIPALVKECRDMDAVAVSLIENIQRQDLNPVEEASAYSGLMEKHGLTQEEIAARVGKSRSFIANTVRLLELPEEIKEMLADGRITAGHARALLALKDARKQAAVAVKIAGEQLSVRQAEKMAKQFLEGKDAGKEKKKEQNKLFMATEQKLNKIFMDRVKIKEARGGGGTIEIKFRDAADLTKISALLTGKKGL